MRGSPVVFISSTSDLADERQALANKLPPAYDPYLFERDRARSQSPEERCREMIEQSDVFVCLLGVNYGSLYSFEVNSPRSIVEWEFDTARSRAEIELMVFRKDPLLKIDQRQQEFLNRVSGFREGVWLKKFATPDELVRQVGESLLHWLVEFRSKVKAARLRHRARVRQWFLGLTFLSIGGLTGVTIAQGGFTTKSLVAVAIAVACLLGLAFAFELGGKHESE
jgi:hypothetical protein